MSSNTRVRAHGPRLGSTGVLFPERVGSHCVKSPEEQEAGRCSSAKRNMEGKPAALLRVCAEGRLSASATPRHPRAVLEASSAGHTGKSGLQRGSDANKPQGC